MIFLIGHTYNILFFDTHSFIFKAFLKCVPTLEIKSDRVHLVNFRSEIAQWNKTTPLRSVIQRFEESVIIIEFRIYFSDNSDYHSSFYI